MKARIVKGTLVLAGVAVGVVWWFREPLLFPELHRAHVMAEEFLSVAPEARFRRAVDANEVALLQVAMSIPVEGMDSLGNEPRIAVEDVPGITDYDSSRRGRELRQRGEQYALVY